MVTGTYCLEKLALPYAWERTASEFFLLHHVGMEGSWLLQDPGSWDHGKDVEREVIVKWSYLAEA